MRVYPCIMLIACLAGLVLLVSTSHGRMDSMHRPLGTDFSQVWAAGVEVLNGRPDAPFDPASHAAEQRALFGDETQFYGWHYPPYFLAIAVALAVLPYLAALAVWQGATLALYLASILAITARSAPLPWILRRDIIMAACAFPAVFVNITHGHNGFLTAALLSIGLLCLRSRPVLAGIVLALLAYKPQFALVIPVALIAQGCWRTILSGAATLAILTGLTVVVFGTKTWLAFGDSLAFTRTVVLEEGNTGWSKIQSTFSAARMLGASIEQAYTLQAIVTVTVLLTIAVVWRSGADGRLKAALLLVGTLLTTPYCLDYDFMILGPALAYAVSHDLERGFRPWEITVFAGVWIVPAVARVVAASTDIPLGLMVTSTFFVVLGLRAVSAISRKQWRYRSPLQESFAEPQV